VTFHFPLRVNGCNLVSVDRCDLKIRKKARDENVHRLTRLKALSWLLTAKLTKLGGSLTVTDFQTREVVFHSAALTAQPCRPVAGIANISCLNAVSERITAALLASGPIREFLCPPIATVVFTTPVLVN
jgi:hypothetical protein